MKVFLLLLRQELREKRFFFLGVAVAGILLLGWALASSLFHSQLQDQAEGLALFVVLGVTLLMGGSWLIRGFGAGGRRGFELARPIPAIQLGGAKLAAILLMAAAGGSLAGLPDLLDAFGLLQEDAGAFGPIFAHGYPLERLDAWARLGWLPSLAVKTLLFLFGLVLVQTVALPVAARKLRSLATLGALVLFWICWSWSYRRLGPYGVEAIGIAAVPLMLIAFSGLGLFGAWRSWARGLLADAHRAYSRTMSAGLLALGMLFAAGSVAATRVDFGEVLACIEVAAGPQEQPGFVKILVGDGPLSLRAGMKPKANCTGDGQVWLVRPHGEPYDLASAEGQPQRVFPWRPRGAAGKGEE